MNRRKVLFLSIALITIFSAAGPLSAAGPAFPGFMLPYTLPFTSYLSLYSFGIYRNPMDAAFDVNDASAGPTFSTLEHSYFFGGFTNLHQISARDSTADAVYAGYYSAGDMPWSAIGVFNAETNQSTRTSGTAPVYETKNVGSELVSWVTETTESNYAYLEDIDTMFYGGALIGLDGMNLGLIGYIRYLNNGFGFNPDSFADTNRTVIYTDYYDTSGIAETPVPAVNYTRTTVYDYPRFDLYLQIALPLFIPLGSEGLTAQATVELLHRDMSGSTTTEITPPQAPGAGSFTAFNSIDVNRQGSLFFDLEAALTLQTIFEGSPDNRFEAGMDGKFGFYNGETSWHDIYQDYDYAGDGAPLVEANNGSLSDSSVTDTQKGNGAFNLDLWTRHSFHFTPFPGINFGVAPVVGMNTAYIPSTTIYTVQRVEVYKEDNNGDGLYVDDVDRVVTTTADYFGNGDGGDFSFGPRIRIPASLRIRPERWPIGVTLGTMMSFAFDVIITRDENSRTAARRVQTDGTGALVSETQITAAGPGFTTTSITTSRLFEHEYRIIVTIPLPGQISVDFLLDGSLLDFERLTIQAVIPLD